MQVRDASNTAIHALRAQLNSAVAADGGGAYGLLLGPRLGAPRAGHAAVFFEDSYQHCHVAVAARALQVFRSVRRSSRVSTCRRAPPCAGRSSSKEQYAWLYRELRMQPLRNATFADKADHFERPPQSVWWRVNGSDFTLSTMGLHAAPGDALAEMDALAGAYKSDVAPSYSSSAVGGLCRAFLSSIQQGTRVLLSLWNSLMFERVPEYPPEH